MRDLARVPGNCARRGKVSSHLALPTEASSPEEQLPLVEQYAQEAMHLAQQTGDQNILARSLDQPWAVQQVRGNMQEADRQTGGIAPDQSSGGLQRLPGQHLCGERAQAYWQGNFPAPSTSMGRD